MNLELIAQAEQEKEASLQRISDAFKNYVTVRACAGKTPDQALDEVLQEIKIGCFEAGLSARAGESLAKAMIPALAREAMTICMCHDLIRGHIGKATTKDGEL